MQDGTGCLENGSGSVGEPRVRIHLPPAASLVRTTVQRAPDRPRQAVQEKLALLACYREGINGRTGGGVPDGLDHGAHVAPRAERGPQPSAARLPRGGRDL